MKCIGGFLALFSGVLACSSCLANEPAQLSLRIDPGSMKAAPSDNPYYRAHVGFRLVLKNDGGEPIRVCTHNMHFFPEITVDGVEVGAYHSADHAPVGHDETVMVLAPGKSFQSEFNFSWTTIDDPEFVAQISMTYRCELIDHMRLNTDPKIWNGKLSTGSVSTTLTAPKRGPAVIRNIGLAFVTDTNPEAMLAVDLKLPTYFTSADASTIKIERHTTISARLEQYPEAKAEAEREPFLRRIFRTNRDTREGDVSILIAPIRFDKDWIGARELRETRKPAGGTITYMLWKGNRRLTVSAKTSEPLHKISDDVHEFARQLALAIPR